MVGHSEKLLLHRPVKFRQLPVTSVVEYKVSKTWQAMMLRDSKDPRVRQVDIEVRTVRKWLASSALREAEEHHE